MKERVEYLWHRKWNIYGGESGIFMAERVEYLWHREWNIYTKHSQKASNKTLCLCI